MIKFPTDLSSSFFKDDEIYWADFSSSIRYPYTKIQNKLSKKLKLYGCYHIFLSICFFLLLFWGFALFSEKYL